MFELIEPVRIEGEIRTYEQRRRARYERLRHVYGFDACFDTTSIGEDSEDIVASDLICQGFHVFVHTDNRAPCDLLVMKGRQTLRIEVKTAQRGKNGKPVGHAPYSLEESDVRAFVFDDGTITYSPDPNDMILQFDAAIRRCLRCGKEVRGRNDARHIWNWGHSVGYICAQCEQG